MGQGRPEGCRPPLAHHATAPAPASPPVYSPPRAVPRASVTAGTLAEKPGAGAVSRLDRAQHGAWSAPFGHPSHRGLARPLMLAPSPPLALAPVHT